MDQSEIHQQQDMVGVVPSAGQMAYSTPYQSTPMVASGTPAVAVPSPTQPVATFSKSPHNLAYQQAQHFHQQQQKQQQQQLQMFWANQLQEIEQTTDFKNHSLPLARIKKIMKADEDVRMISAEAAKENKRRTLQKNDLAAAISRTDVFDFLVDIIPRDELKEEGLGVTKATIPVVGSPADIPYYYVPPLHPMGPTGMIMGKPVDQATLYATQQPRPPIAFMPWPQTQRQQQQTDT
ncbi:Nuclear transcription factor Y subunit C [Quillaja saponaria]|uniref:Nuclear transcription factor Y subunit C n=1 Tax=Quillaja saponaria TaxID=32244 RepID=A0AAD7QIF2_QUISA|nr:Nuclear transcription factor Y subunit C [Quillaja saponaria]